MKLLLALLIPFSLFFWSCSTVPQTPVYPPSEANPKIFSKYVSNGKSTMMDSWSRSFDMSGVSFNHKRTCTLITPRHVVMAKHFQRKINSTLTFHDRDGYAIQRTLIKIIPCEGDVAVGLLGRPVPERYTPYPLPSQVANTASLVGKPIAVTDQNKLIFFHLIRNIGNGILSMQYDPESTHGFGKKLISGDSGNPSFVIINNELVLMETHLTGGPGAGPYFGDPNIQQSIIEAVNTLDPNYNIRTVRF